jgi:dTDP-4-amino-4,6-dideoxygalactose transaminase
MSAFGVYKITEQFEQKLCEYTGAPYAVAVDNCSNALFLALMWWKKLLKEKSPRDYDYLLERGISIPAKTYPAVPCEIIHAGLKVVFEPMERAKLTGGYWLRPTPILDCALRFTRGMYNPGTYQCLSFTGPKKHLKLSKGGAILTDSEEAYNWFKKARFSGRSEKDYLQDDFDKDPVIGWNFYMMPEIAARGLLLMQAFPQHNEDLEIEYPDLSRFKVYQQ